MTLTHDIEGQQGGLTFWGTQRDDPLRGASVAAPG
jgi:hypothetical protein